MNFQKYQGLGNDFIIVNCLKEGGEGKERLTTEDIARFCHRKYGIGADGIILLERSEGADYRMRLYNSDGSEAEISGNGLRCLALYINDNGIDGRKGLLIETGGGYTRTELAGGNRVRVWMPRPIYERERIPMIGEGECVDSELDFGEGGKFKVTALAVGNPHCVIFGAFTKREVQELGPVIEKSSYFPQRVNVDFVKVMSPDRIKAEFFERGVGITEACGSGACASVIAGIKTGRLKFDLPVTVEMAGGELIVTVKKGYSEIILEGEAERVFEGAVFVP